MLQVDNDPYCCDSFLCLLGKEGPDIGQTLLWVCCEVWLDEIWCGGSHAISWRCWIEQKRLSKKKTTCPTLCSSMDWFLVGPSPLNLYWNWTNSSPRSPACWLQILGHLCLHNCVSVFYNRSLYTSVWVGVNRGVYSGSSVSVAPTSVDSTNHRRTIFGKNWICIEHRWTFFLFFFLCFWWF